MIDIGEDTGDAAGMSDEELASALEGADTEALDAEADRRYAEYLHRWGREILDADRGRKRLKGWVTIGAQEGGDGERHGGTHVYIDDATGRITAGPAGMVGKKPSELKPAHRVTAEHGERHPETGEGPPARGGSDEREPEGREPDGRAGGRAGGEAGGAGPEVAGEAARPGAEAGDQGGQGGAEPAHQRPAKNVPARVEAVNKRLDRYERLFRSRGNHRAADWMGQLRGHIGSVGVESALESLGPEAEGEGEEVQYGGHNLEGADADFIERYLDRAGISLVAGYAPAGEARAVSTVTPSSDEEGLHERGDARDFFPKLQTLRDKLHEAQHLPGLEKSEDLSKLMGGEFGAEVPNFSPEVTKKLDDTYGEGKWIVKSYGDEAYAGYGIFFPQRVKQLQQEARNTIWIAGENLARFGFKIGRDPDTDKVIGLVHESGDIYPFGSKKYNKTIQGEARHWADRAEEAADSEHGTAIPEGRFMAQPAFPVVGVSNEERAQGVTFKKGQEGRVHVVTRNGKAELVPHSTWLKQEPMPVVFESDDTRAMARAAVEAINALPESERQGQLYAPDIVKTADGYRVVEANPANEAGASGYLQDNPFVIDSYVSHITGREPAHVAFIRRLLTSRKRSEGNASARTP